ncbi:unnamed protein product [Ilex paraguariensis]|uniref:UBX domain-containing protein n=1 Tax=Ilex paraguariensis TaxID=185542 RepID=A0ABC8TPB3_9AQUA
MMLPRMDIDFVWEFRFGCSHRLGFAPCDDPESTHLEKSTWTDSKVAESLSKYCILLHILGGSTDAAQFSALYPQKSVPCITAIGYNGVQLWQKDGFVSAEDLASSLEKAWLGLHIQETTATLLTAALASKKSEVPSGACDAAAFEQGSSSRTNIPSSSTDKLVHSSEATPLLISEDAIEEPNSKLGEEVSPESDIACESESKVFEYSSSTATEIEQVHPVDLNSTHSTIGHQVEDEFPAPEESLNGADHKSKVSMEASELIANEASEAVPGRKAETVEVEKIDVSDSSTSKSNEVHINIRLPDGGSLKERFSVMSTLRMVKDFVDENLESSIGSYDLAIPYPRKVFGDQGMNFKYPGGPPVLLQLKL